MKRNGLIIGLMFSMIFFPIFSSYAADPKSKPAKPASETLAKPVEKPLPDLVVERVWLDAQSQINFQIKNAGKGEIPDSEHNQGVVKVDYGKGHEEFYFSKTSSKAKSPVDPKGVLKKPGGSVQYDTKIKVESPVTVTVVVDEGKKIAESNDLNNSSTPTTLTPPSLSLPEKARVTQPEEKPTIDKEMKVTKAASPAFKPPGAPVLRKVIDGIDIISPGEGWVLTPGQQFGLKLKSVWTSRQTVIFIVLYRIREDGSNEAVIEQRFTGSSCPVLNPGATVIMEQQIPESAQEGVYIYQVLTSGMYHSYSDRFGIRPAGSRASIQVVTPGGGGEHWKTGSTHTIRWYYRGIGTTAPERWSMTLNRVGGIGSGSDYTKTFVSGVQRQWLGDKWEYTHEWPIPQNFPAGDYKIGISGEVGKRNIVRGEGNLNFTIGGGGWDLKVDRIYTDPVSGNLMAEVLNERPTVSGRVDFRVEYFEHDRLGNHGRLLQTWDLQRTLSGGEKEIVDLGKLGPLAGPPPPSSSLGKYCGMDFKVTVDSTNRIDETDERNNSKSIRVSYFGRVGRIYISVPHNGTISNTDFIIEIVDCGTPEARGSYLVWQRGDWPDEGKLSKHHDNVIYEHRHDGGEKYCRIFSSQMHGLQRVTSEIEIQFFDDFTFWVNPSHYRFQIRIP